MENILMQDEDFIIGKIALINEDNINIKKPYIPTAPRNKFSAAYIISGELDYTVENERHTVCDGDILFIRPGYIDRASAGNSGVSHFITFDFEMECIYSSKVFPINYCNKISENAGCLTLFTEALSLWKHKNPGYRIKCREILYRILNCLLQQSYVKDENCYQFRKIKTAVYYIEENYGNTELNIDMLAGLCSMSTGNFGKLFKLFYGIPPAEYIRGIRIKHAKELLKNSTNRIGEIATQTGYSSIYGFSHSFKRETGISPSRWISDED